MRLASLLFLASLMITAGCATIDFCNNSEETITFVLSSDTRSLSVEVEPGGQEVRTIFLTFFGFLDAIFFAQEGQMVLGECERTVGFLETLKVTWDGSTFTCVETQ